MKTKFKNWDLWKKGVSWSFLDRFLRNRMECYLMYEERWTPKLVPHFIEFGQAFHHIMERGYRMYKGPPTIECCQKMGSGYVIRLMEQSKLLNRVAVQEQAELAATVAYRYFKNYKDDFKGTWRKLEERFSYPYKYPDGKVAPINGVVDATTVLKNKTWVLDTKTRSELSIEETLDEFPFNFQVNLYMLRYMEENGKPPAGAILNCVKRPGQRMTQKLDGNSRSAFLARISSEIAEDPDKYFQRPFYPVDKDAILHWKETQLDPIMREVRLWYEGVLPTFTNPCGLYVKRRRTDYFDAMVEGDFTMLYRKPAHGQTGPNKKSK
jgi:hypothetical protein